MVRFVESTVLLVRQDSQCLEHNLDMNGLIFCRKCAGFCFDMVCSMA